MLVAHHLIIDGISWRILLDDLAILIKQYSEGLPPQVEKKSSSFKSWAEHFNGARIIQPTTDELNYWKGLEKISKQYFEVGLRVDHSSDNANYVNERLSIDNTQILLHKANQIYNSKTHELLLSMVALTLNKILKLETFLFEIEGHGRSLIASTMGNFGNTVGWFTQSDLLRLDIVNPEIKKTILSVKEQIRKMDSHNGRFSVLRDILKVIPSFKDSIKFNYLGDFDITFNQKVFKYIPLNTGPDISDFEEFECPLEINFWIINGELQIRLFCSRNSPAQVILADIGRAIKMQIEQLTTDVALSNEIELTPSDFATTNLSQSELNSLFE